MRKLQWDSDFWGVNVYHLNNIETLDLKQLNNQCYLVQALVNVRDISFIGELEDKGFGFKESKITLFKKNKRKIIKIPHNFKVLSLSDLEPYEHIFFELYGVYTRYNIFPSDKVNKFYYTWLINSIRGQMDDQCIGYFIDDELAGFITYKRNDSHLIIGLLGVLPNFRGRGISQLLLNYVDNVAFKSGLDGIKVSTQGTNIIALNAYIRNGYTINSIDHWYYLTKGEFR
ncbi:GNAT family N-acetyltransferase [Mesobacillus subterraneus]|uniref:GNAT family N-acetyltransferase n=1 Tax=Mesobacillus subterraneus TaxID=285983 RepID=A0A427TRG4_9BACI|nr:GNAT family N-acetyltransferase [Mesobacillus subterraneus]RSD26959.1 GNAT family N-acetyltransferase [Mesobacillus subterraneus]